MSNNTYALGFMALLNPSWAARIARQERESEVDTFKRLMKDQKPQVWDDLKTKFEPRIFLDAKTWQPPRLFNVTAVLRKGMTEDKLRKATIGCPGNKDFRYGNLIFPKSHPMPTKQGHKDGAAYFSGDVVTPVLYQFHPYAKPEVWMGITPMEVFTQRQGVRLATGRVVVGGLGLGWFLNAVALKPTVTEIVLVEKHQFLIDWLLPRIKGTYPAVAKKLTKVVTSDVYEFMEGDSANHASTRYLLDIWASYREYDHKFEQWQKKLPRKQLWGWGQLADRNDYR